MQYPLINAPWSRIETRVLVQLFEQSFQFYAEHPSLCTSESAQNFMHNIQTLVGLGFTAAQVSEDLIANFHELVTEFLCYHPFYKFPQQASHLASIVADIIVCSCDLFKELEYPCYTSDFELALMQCLRHILKDLDIKPAHLLPRFKSLMK
jgi:hypothetical protein